MAREQHSGRRSTKCKTFSKWKDIIVFEEHKGHCCGYENEIRERQTLKRQFKLGHPGPCGKKLEFSFQEQKVPTCFNKRKTWLAL